MRASDSFSIKQNAFFLHEEKSEKRNKLSEPDVMSNNPKIEYCSMYCHDDLELIILFSENCDRNQ